MEANNLMEDRKYQNRCTAKSKQSGERCKREAGAGKSVCYIHGGEAPQVKEAAMRRLRDAADPVAGELVKMAMSGKVDNIKLGAAKDLLDRAGVGEAKRIEVDITDEMLRAEIDRLRSEMGDR